VKRKSAVEEVDWSTKRIFVFLIALLIGRQTLYPKIYSIAKEGVQGSTVCRYSSLTFLQLRLGDFETEQLDEPRQERTREKYDLRALPGPRSTLAAVVKTAIAL